MFPGARGQNWTLTGACVCTRLCMWMCVHICVLVFVCICLQGSTWSALAQGSLRARATPPPSIENWLQEFWPPGPAIQVMSPEQFAFLTGPKSWGREVQTLEWAGRLYLDFLGLSEETCFFPVLFCLGRVMCKFFPPKQMSAWSDCHTLMP